jgi:hypothetical protein
MKKILITSDKYSFCLDGFQQQIKKYWPEDLEFDVLAFNKPKAILNDNFKLVYAGDGFNDSTIWRDALNPYFESLQDDYFFLAFEDHFLVDYVNLDLLYKAENHIKNDPTIGKIRLLPKYNFKDDPELLFENLSSYDDNFYFAPKVRSAVVYNSLRPSLWRKNFFLKLLNNHREIRNPHEFETKNNFDKFEETVLLPKQSYPIYPDLDAMRGGRLNTQVKNAGLIDMDYYNLVLKEEDLPVFWEVEKRIKKYGI